MTPPARHRRGQTLIELVVATFLVAAVVAPALALMRDSMATSRLIEDRNMMTTLAVSKLEEQLIAVANDFQDATLSGNFSSEGYPRLGYQVLRTQQAGGGGIPNRLMAVTVTVWRDNNGNGTLDPDEERIVLASKLARMSY